MSKIENLTPVSAESLRKRLGFNVDPNNLWELEMAKQAGAIEVRMGPSWNKVEVRAGQYRLPPAVSNALRKAAELHLEPLLVAAYGPPWRKLTILTVSRSVQEGETTIPIRETGQLKNIKPYYDYVLEKPNKQIVADGYWAYPGAPIAAVDPASGTITLDAPTAMSLSPGDRLMVNRRPYPPPESDDETTDLSIQAYGRYVEFLARSLASLSSAARIEIWNEPPWKHDLWDSRGCFHYPKGHNCNSPNFGIARLLTKTNPPPNVRYNWGGTHKSGFNSLFDKRMSPSPVEAQIKDRISSESFHPYGPTPESSAWDPACLEKADPRNVWPCALEGTSKNSNFKSEAKLAELHKKEEGWTIERNITEVGLPTSNQAAKARYILRAFITYSSLGYKRINFYRLADRGTYGFVDLKSHQPFPSYAAIKNFIEDLSPYAARPLHAPLDLPEVVAYHGSWPLTVVPIVARASEADRRNSVLLAIWQRTYADTPAKWISLPSPVPGEATIKIQPGFAVTAAWDLLDRSRVPYVRAEGNLVKVQVKDAPVIVKIEPAKK